MLHLLEDTTKSVLLSWVGKFCANCISYYSLQKYSDRFKLLNVGLKTRKKFVMSASTPEF